MAIKQVRNLPNNFLWGVASSAYQVEGCVDVDGRGPSVWDDYCRRPGAVFDGHSGREGCDHYRRYKEDVDLISNLGVHAYRFSLSWSRILPSGRGQVNSKGLDFYKNLVDALLEKNVQPWITLFHWDFPSELFFQGGWLNRDSASWFADYTQIVCEALSDRVEHWITLNEPQCFLGLGHYLEIHAPGLRYSKADLLRATHHSLLAHGKAVQVLRSSARQKPIIGWSPVGWVSYPATDSPEDIEAARQAMFSIDPAKKAWPLNNTWYSDPVILGHYPEDGLKIFEADLPPIESGDLKVISEPLDFYGVNIYHGAPISRSVSSEEPEVKNQRELGHPLTLMGWTVDPQALYWGPKFLYERYKLPIYVTENGVAAMDWVNAKGKVDDAPRVDFMDRYIGQLSAAVADGTDVRGYFLWSIMDNFEWELGYSRRFGLVYVDYQTFERVPKTSYYWYKDLVASNGDVLTKEPAQLR